MGSHEQSQPGRHVFLSAEWRDLLMLNYEVDPALLKVYTPPGTELDSFDGKTFISLVGFRFVRTRLFGFCPVPFHSDFDEVNLRLYVLRCEGTTVRRGVVFIREIVPKWFIARIARLVYGENYSRFPMRHFKKSDGTKLETEYQWKLNRLWCRLYGQTSGISLRPREGSLEQFITEHYWGYSTRGRETLEYEVAHPPWKVWTCTAASFEGDGATLYSPEIGLILERQPTSACVADGSSVSVFAGRRLS
jgi:uncharacterized protein YqjF (DUF2071 family)